MPKATLVFSSKYLSRRRVRVFTGDRAKRSSVKFFNKLMLAVKAKKTTNYVV